jgi:perosamine synthetase
LIHEQKPYLGSRTYNIAKASTYQEHIVNVPCSTNLTKQEIDRVLECLQRMV